MLGLWLLMLSTARIQRFMLRKETINEADGELRTIGVIEANGGGAALGALSSLDRLHVALSSPILISLTVVRVGRIVMHCVREVVLHLSHHRCCWRERLLSGLEHGEVSVLNFIVL